MGEHILEGTTINDKNPLSVAIENWDVAADEYRAFDNADLDTNLTQLSGWSMEENAAIAGDARVYLRDNTVGGAIVAVIRIAGGGDDQRNFSHPILVPGGVYVDLTVGNVRGAIYGKV